MRWSQVSRLGNPLVNEVVTPTALKDLWNRWTPSRDKYFQRFYRTPILAKVMNQLYHLGVLHGPDARGHAQGQLSIPVTQPDKFSRLGVLGGDLQGWPNGRRLGDDVVDIAEQAVAGALVGKKVPLGDGVDGPDRPRLPVFPYEPDPGSGFANEKGK